MVLLFVSRGSYMAVKLQIRSCLMLLFWISKAVQAQPRFLGDLMDRWQSVCKKLQ